MALEKGDFDRSEAILEMGIKVSQDHRVYLGLPYIFEALTSIALLRGDIEKAERILVDGIEKLIQIGMPEDNHHVVDFKLRLSRIYSSFRLEVKCFLNTDCGVTFLFLLLLCNANNVYGLSQSVIGPF